MTKTKATESPPPMRYVSIYYQRGPAPKGSGMRFAVQDPPTSGWSRGFLIPGAKTSTIFCPFTMESFRVDNGCTEVEMAKDVPLWDDRKLARLVTDNWERFTRMGFQRDYDVAALVLTNLGAEVPRFLPPEPAEGEEPTKRGGKELNVEGFRPVRKGSKRGLVAEFFLSGEGPQSIREAMARLDLSRSGVLSHLFCLNRDHGIGYELVNDCARLIIPEGLDIFAFPEQPAASSEPSEDGQSEPQATGTSERPQRKPQGKPLDASRVKAIPAPSKRADVARFFLDWASIEEAMGKFELTRSAVLSMLYQIWKDNGFGHEVDGERARLLTPTGVEVFGEKQPRKKKEAA
jgi:hypothetical protein